MAWMCYSIAFLCIFLQIVKEFDKKSAPNLRRMNSDDLHFSGNAILNKKYWVWITASFSHGSMFHVINNMIMMLPYSSHLEEQFGPFTFLVLYILVGAAGKLLVV